MGVRVFARSKWQLVYVWRPYTHDMRLPAGGWSDRGFIVDLRHQALWVAPSFESILAHDPYCLENVVEGLNPFAGIEDLAWMSLVTHRPVPLSLLYRPRRVTRAKDHEMTPGIPGYPTHSQDRW